VASDVSENVDERLRKLEQEISKLRTPYWIELFKAVSPIIAGLVVAITGYLLTGSISNALQQGQLQLSNVREMRDLLLKLGDPKISLDEATATARTLSAFEHFAVPPLISLLESGSETKILAAEEGLRAVGLSNPAAVCKQLLTVFNNRTRLFSLETHRRTIRLTGQLACRESIPWITEYRALLDASSESQDFTSLSRIFKNASALNLRSFEQISHEVSESLKLLEEAETN
jgi:hypothetical protein